MEIYSDKYKITRGRIPTTERGVEQRILDIYELNKDELDTMWARRKAEDEEYRRKMHKKPKKYQDSYTLFRNSVLNLIADEDDNLIKGANVNEAIKEVFNQDYYTDADTRGRRNITTAVRADEKFFHDFRMAAGWKNKFNPELFVFHSEYGSKGLWIYNNLFAIDTDNSPKDGAGGGLKIVPIKELQARLF